MKLEGIYDKAAFLSPKLYALKNKDSAGEIIKIKGSLKRAKNQYWNDRVVSPNRTKG